ncbi:MAG: hypothetical protein ABIH11_04045, partial [Candidatus Altiarchaeota archaeon]
LNNLKYIPSFRTGSEREDILRAFTVGFKDKYEDIVLKKDKLLRIVREIREDWLNFTTEADESSYAIETERIVSIISHLMDQDPDEVVVRLLKAKADLDKARGN